MWHPESESLFLVQTQGELHNLWGPNGGIDGAHCMDVTDLPEHWRRFKESKT